MKTDERNKFAIKSFLGEYLDLRKDKDNELATVDSIRKGVEFKGANLWILIFAIFMASLGLNVNSTAVIIGAMLISPLMGPIMGVGLSVGLNDFELMKRSLKSFLITTAFSVTTATIFFLFAPIAGSQSELLARTSPTIYDVFIALFGGLAGVVALSTKEKGNVIPGVAIATALMPPLCTAGYGLASGNLIYFLGAFYLYFINSVFISLATFLGVRVMHFQRKEFVDKTREKTVRKYIVLIVILTMCPAVYLTYGIIKSTFYEAAANRFINEQLGFDNTQVLDKKISYEHKEVRVVLIGSEVPDASISIARSKLKEYKLDDTKLIVLQGMNNEAVDVSSIRAMVMEDFYKNSEERLVEQTKKITVLEQSLARYKSFDELGKTIVPELKVLYPSVKTVSISHAIELTIDSVRTDTITLAVLKFGKHPDAHEKQKITEWLKGILSAGIKDNLSGMFDSVNSQIGEIAGEVGKTPAAWNGGVFSMIQSLSENVIVPIAGLILTFVMCYELIQMVIDKNNLHDVDTWMFFKWIFKTFCAVLIVTNTWNIVMAVFDMAQSVVSQSAGVIISDAGIDISGVVGNLETTLADWSIGSLLGLWFQSIFVGLCSHILTIAIFLVIYGRMIEVYLTVSVGPIPFATMANREWGQTGQNYLKSLLALGFQAFLIMVCVGIYAVLVQNIAVGDDITVAIWECLGYTVLLCYTLFRTGSLAKSLFGAH